MSWAPAPYEPTFESRRSPVLGLNGMVATSQPLAAQAGLEVLQAGGNAADAAVATGAALAVTEPCSTGIGGDMFALYFDAATKQVHAINGHGRAPAALTLDALHERGVGPCDVPPERFSVHTVTVPGAAAGWSDLVARHGRLPLGDVLHPAIRLAEQGHPVAPIISRYWEAGSDRLRNASPNGSEMLIDGIAPHAGQAWRNPRLGRVLRELAEGGPEAFYRGRAGAAIVEVVQQLGGWLTLDDLVAHESTFEAPISTTYHGHTVYQCPPSGQGLVGLIALNILEECDLGGIGRGDPARYAEYLHTQIEAIRLGFEDGRNHIADPAMAEVPVERLLSKEYAAERRTLIDPERAIPREAAVGASDTVYAAIVDGEGNACSFINSNYNGFGTAIVPRDCGFTLHNRGSGFVYEPDHPNSLEPGKRPYHTIIPALSTDTNGNFHACFGVMGAWHQPQGHVQVFMNLIDRHMDPQAALDEPRFSIYDDPPNSTVFLEDSMPAETREILVRRGHPVATNSGFDRTATFGRGQVITRDPSSGALQGGSDPRADGAAVAY